MSLRICEANEMRSLDQAAKTEFGIDATTLMENAGRAAVQILFETFPRAGQETEVLVLAGKGNNAGDAFVVARRLLCLERKVRVFHLVPEDQYSGAAHNNFQILKRLGAKVMHLENAGDLEAYFKHNPGPFTVVDGILGTGLKGNLEGIFYDVVELVNSLGCEQVISLDLPSGVNSDTGEVQGAAVDANLTVSFGFPKLGHFFAPGAAKRGELVNVDISLPPNFRKQGNKFLLMKRPLASHLSKRDAYAHKNSFGHALLVGGHPGTMGAIVMAARACHKMGTGLVSVATWKEGYNLLLNKIPDETMALPIVLQGDEYYEDAKGRLSDFSSVVVGPGLGHRKEGPAMLEDLVTVFQGPLVIDADALNLIAKNKLHSRLLSRRGPTVMTPHPGEMARLLDWSTEKVTAQPFDAVKELCDQTNAIVVLKGAATVIGSSEGVFYVNHYPNDGMATAGSGDVLAGMIGGLLGQSFFDPFVGTQLGVLLHSVAGDLAAKAQGARSMTANDIVKNLGAAFRDVEAISEPHFPTAGRAKLH